MFLFCGFGLLSKHSPMSFVAVAVGAMAVSTAMYLIMDLSAPYSGLFRASSEPIEQVLDYMNKKSCGTVLGRAAELRGAPAIILSFDRIAERRAFERNFP